MTVEKKLVVSITIDERALIDQCTKFLADLSKEIRKADDSFDVDYINKTQKLLCDIADEWG